MNPESGGTLAGETVYRWDYLSKGEPDQGEGQLRMTPEGSCFYSSWLEKVTVPDVLTWKANK